MGELEDEAEDEVEESGGELTGDEKIEWEGKDDTMKGNLDETGRKLDGSMQEKDV